MKLAFGRLSTAASRDPASGAEKLSVARAGRHYSRLDGLADGLEQVFNLGGVRSELLEEAIA